MFPYAFLLVEAHEYWSCCDISHHDKIGYKYYDNRPK